MTEIFLKNLKALRDKELKNELLHFANENSHYVCLDDLNFFDKNREVPIYRDMKEEILRAEALILQNSPRYPFIFLYGVANGLLIKRLAGRGYRYIFVFETEIELLYLALSVCDLSLELSLGGVHFFNPLQERAQFKLALLFNNPHILELYALMPFFTLCDFYIKFFPKNIAFSKELCHKVFEQLLNSKSINFPELSFYQYENVLRNTPLMLASIPMQKLIKHKKGSFKNAVIVSAGPSLQKDLALLKKEQNTLVIFATDAVLATLCAEGIEPDFVLSNDYDDLVLEFFKKIPQKPIFVCGDSSSHKLASFLKKQNLALCIALSGGELSSKFDDFRLDYGGSFVSYFAYHLALKLGFENIIMLGQDFALSRDGNSHTKGYPLGVCYEKALDYVSYFEVEMWGGGKCLTHSVWNFYRLELEWLIASHKGINFFNASMSGARIAGSIELSFELILQKLDLSQKPCENFWKEIVTDEREFLGEFCDFLKENIKTCEFFMEQGLAFGKNLRVILKASPENILLEKMYENIEKFNTLLAEDKFINDGKLNYVFVKRGEFCAKLLRQKIKNEKRYLFKFIAYYLKWLEFFAGELGRKKAILEKALFLL